MSEPDFLPSILHKLRYISELALAELIALKRYRPDITIDRAEIEAVWQAFIQGGQRLLFVTGPNGAGKTTWLCNVTESLLLRGKPVLFESAERLSGLSFPEVLTTLLQDEVWTGIASGEFRSTSSDEQIIVALDDVGAFGQADNIIRSLHAWLVTLPDTTPIRVVVTIRTDKFQNLMDTEDDIRSSPIVRHYHVPPLNSYELLKLAEKLPVPQGVNREQLLSVRRQVAARIAEVAQGLARHPGVAVVFLEATTVDVVPATFSTVHMYNELLRRVVRDPTERDVSANEERGQVLQDLASIMLQQATLIMPVTDNTVAKLRKASGDEDSSASSYLVLLSNGVLVESVSDSTTYVSFADTRFFEFVAARAYPLRDLSDALAHLCAQSRWFQSALSIAAFVFVRAVELLSPIHVYSSIEDLVDEREQLILELALFDEPAFLLAFGFLARVAPFEAQSVISLLIHIGEPRLAAQAALLLIESATDEPELLREAHYLRAHALYVTDDYDTAMEELFRLNERKSSRVLTLQAEIAVSQGDFQLARSIYSVLLTQYGETPSEEKAMALRGSGYVLGRMGQVEEAERRLREAIGILTSLGADTSLAEATGDLGQLLADLGRTTEARQYLQQNMNICISSGHLTGVGIVEGLLAELDMREGQWEQAERRLQKALEISRRVANRWREAWTLERIGILNLSRGLKTEGETCLAEANRLRKAIGVLKGQ